MKLIPLFPVGLPALIALGIGFVLFLITLIAANLRVGRRTGGGQKDARSMTGIVLQGLGIACAGFGPLRLTLPINTVEAIVQGMVVALLMAGTIGLFWWSSRAMGRNWAIVAQTRADHELVQSGPFAWVRNPIYGALFLFLLAMGVGYGHYWNILPGAVLYWTGTMMRVRIEERLLSAQFGAAYDDYRARVKRFVPGLI